MSHNHHQDELGTGLTILSFFIPLAGTIVYFTKKDTQPSAARSACHAALWGFGIIVLNILMTVAGGV